MILYSYFHAKDILGETAKIAVGYTKNPASSSIMASLSRSRIHKLPFVMPK